MPDTGDLRGDLHAWATASIAEASRPEELALLRAAGTADPGAPQGFASACTACLVGRGSQVEEILAHAAQRGEGVPRPTRVLDHLVAPIYFRALFGLPTPSVGVLVEPLVVPPAAAQATSGSLG